MKARFSESSSGGRTITSAARVSARFVTSLVAMRVCQGSPTRHEHWNESVAGVSGTFKRRKNASTLGRFPSEFNSQMTEKTSPPRRSDLQKWAGSDTFCITLKLLHSMPSPPIGSVEPGGGSAQTDRPAAAVCTCYHSEELIELPWISHYSLVNSY